MFAGFAGFMGGESVFGTFPLFFPKPGVLVQKLWTGVENAGGQLHFQVGIRKPRLTKAMSSSASIAVHPF